MEEEIVSIDDSPIIKDSINLALIKNIILIDNTIETPEIFFSSNSDDTLPIYYNCCTDKNKLFDYLEKEFVNINRIGFIFNNSMMNSKYFLNSELFFTENDLIQFETNKDSLSSYSSNVSFLIKLIKKFDVKNVDFLACNSLEYDNWKIYYDLLQHHSSSIIGASKDLTGNIKYGANWIMENTNEDIQNIYFNENITNYSSTLVSSSISYNIGTTKGRSVFLFIIETTNNFTSLVLDNFSNLVFEATGTDIDTRYNVHYREENTGLFILASNLNNLNINLLPKKRYEIILNFANSKTTNNTGAYYRYGGVPDITSRTAVLVFTNELKMYPSYSAYVSFSSFNPNNTTTYNGIKNLNNTKYQSLTLNYSYELTISPQLSSFTVADKKNGDASFQIQPPTSLSTGLFSYVSSNGLVASILGNIITIIGPGTTIIKATQAAAGIYASETITATFIVIQPISPQLSSFTVADKKNGDASFPIQPPTSLSTGLFSYVSSNGLVASILGNIITIIGPGTTIIKATQAAAGIYASETITATFTVKKTLNELINSKSPVSELLALEITSKDLIDKGFTASVMKQHGYNAKDLKLLDYPIKQMKRARFTLSTLLKARFLLGKLTAYYSSDDFLALGIDAPQLSEWGITKERLREMGFVL